MAMIVLNLTMWRNSILFPLRGHLDTFRCSPGQLRSRQHTVKSATYFTVRQSNLVEAPQLSRAGCGIYGRRTYQLGAVGGHTSLLACGGFVACFVVCAFPAPGASPSRPSFPC